MKKTLTLFSILLLIFSCTINTAISQQNIETNDESYINETENSIYIGNNFLELSFDKTYHGGFDSLIDKQTGIDLRPDKQPIPTLYLMFFYNGSASEGALQWQAYNTEYITETTSTYAKLIIQNTNLKGYDIHTTTTITIHKDTPYAEMRLHIENNEDFIIETILFPIIWGLGQIGSDASDDTLFYPGGDGLLLHDPLSKIDTLHVAGDIYPGTLSIQLLCHYDKDETGLYFASYDTEGNPKKINYGPMEWDGTNHLATSYELYIPENPGNDFSMNYDIIVGTFQGDWYKAAEMYKQWAETTPFVSKGKIGEGKDTPEWFLNTQIIQLLNIPEPETTVYTLDEIVEITDQYTENTGIDTTVLIIGWEKNGAWIGPDYYPPIEGEQAFKKGMNDLKNDGNHGFIYNSGTVWRITRNDMGYADYEYFNTTGKPWAAYTKEGIPHYDPFYATLGWHCARMDPMTEFWHDMVVDNALEAAKLGVDVLQIDEFPIGAIYPCYNTEHGHPIGYSAEISDAYCSILDDIRTQCRDINPDFIISIEEPCEYYIPYIDTYVSRDNSPESLLYQAIVETYGESAEFIPFFSYVYHEYITSFGEGMGIDEDYATYFYNQMARSIARMFTSGEIIKAGGSREESWNMDLFELYQQTAQATTSYAKEYLLYGKPVTPPEITVPTKKIEWYNMFSDQLGTPIYEPVIFHSAWRADDQTKAYIFTNWDTTTHEFTVSIEDELDTYETYAVATTRNGEKTYIYANTTLPKTITLSLDQNDIVLIELEKSIDTYPPDTPLIQGPTTGKINTELTYTLKTTDPDQDSIYFYIDWGDGQKDIWLGPYQSNESIEITHTYQNEGTYEIRVKAKDQIGLESQYTTLQVTMPKNKWFIYHPILRFFLNHPAILQIFNKTY